MTAMIARTADARSVLTFRVQGRTFAMDAASVQEVVRAPRITRVPGAPAGLQGVTNLRGTVTPVVSAATLLTPGAENTADAGAVIVMDFTSPLA
ncbi:MAG: chemotaxis protein CheW, partial [Brevundimonas sp.]